MRGVVFLILSHEIMLVYCYACIILGRVGRIGGCGNQNFDIDIFEHLEYRHRLPRIGIDLRRLGLAFARFPAVYHDVKDADTEVRMVRDPGQHLHDEAHVAAADRTRDRDDWFFALIPPREQIDETNVRACQAFTVRYILLQLRLEGRCAALEIIIQSVFFCVCGPLSDCFISCKYLVESPLDRVAAADGR